ncbi:hypothetical protein JL722_9824 [Aureococcus anophagefferens]|nr:hypothetical protein JL722_9824 [Aureococcus anophagefferens]
MVRVDARGAPGAAGATLAAAAAAVAETVAELYVLDGGARASAASAPGAGRAAGRFDLVEASAESRRVRALSPERAAGRVPARRRSWATPGPRVAGRGRRGGSGSARRRGCRISTRSRTTARATGTPRAGARRSAPAARRGALGAAPRGAAAELFVPLTEAYDACAAQEAPLYDEMVWVLGKTGKTAEALALLLDKIGSVKRAVRFVEAHDRSLWSTLIRHALRDARPRELDDAIAARRRRPASTRSARARGPGRRQARAPPAPRAAIDAAARDCANDCLLRGGVAGPARIAASRPIVATEDRRRRRRGRPPRLARLAVRGGLAAANRPGLDGRRRATSQRRAGARRARALRDATVRAGAD